MVEKFADIRPKGMVRLVGYLGDEIKRVVAITPEQKYDFKITDAIATKGDFIRFAVSEHASETTGYLLTVENTRSDKGRYVDTIILKTTSNIRPEIKIKVYGEVREKKQKTNEKKPDDEQHTSGGI